MFTNMQGKSTNFYVIKFISDLRHGRAQQFMLRLQSMFASVPYEMNMDCEKNLHNALLILMMLLGQEVKAEYHTSNGRIDLFIATDKYYYIIELKLDGTATEALEQINDKNYALPFAVDDRQIVKVGANFTKQSRTIAEWLITE